MQLVRCAGSFFERLRIRKCRCVFVSELRDTRPKKRVHDTTTCSHRKNIFIERGLNTCINVYTVSSSMCRRRMIPTLLSDVSRQYKNLWQWILPPVWETSGNAYRSILRLRGETREPESCRILNLARNLLYSICMCFDRCCRLLLDCEGVEVVTSLLLGPFRVVDSLSAYDKR